MKICLYGSSVYSYHLFSISSFSARSLLFLCFIMPILTWHVPLIAPIFLKRSIVFLTLLFSSIYLHCSFKEAFLSLLAILWNSAFSWIYLSLSTLPFTSLLFSAIVRPPQTTIFAFLCFFFLGMVLVTAFCTVLWTSVHSSLGTLTTRYNPLNLFVTSSV